MNHCHYHILWPGGNTTAIVDQYPTTLSRSALAQMIMVSRPEIEQVGFISPSDNADYPFCLHMMGGEFCGNAARSAAYLYARRSGLDHFSFMVSGFNQPVRASVTEQAAAITLPGEFMLRKKSAGDHVVVDLQGICHIVVFGDRQNSTSTDLIRQYFQPDLAAIGIMYVKRDKQLTLDPVVYVRDMKKLVAETACGSGSIAVALALRSDQSNFDRYVIQQPTGAVFTVEVTANSHQVQSIFLEGPVSYQGEASLVLPPVASEKQFVYPFTRAS